MDRLKSLPDIAELHAGAVQAHRDHCVALMKTSDFQAMRAQLLAASPYAPAEEEIRKLIGLPV